MLRLHYSLNSLSSLCQEIPYSQYSSIQLFVSSYSVISIPSFWVDIKPPQRPIKSTIQRRLLKIGRLSRQLIAMWWMLP